VALTIDDLLRAHYFEFRELVVSPDEREALVVFGSCDMPHEDYSEDQMNRSIWRLDLSNGSHVQLTAPEEDSRSPAWSPDGGLVAHVSRRSGRDEIWLMDRDGNPLQQLTDTDHPARGPYQDCIISWSPDGRKIAYTAVPNGGIYAVFIRTGAWTDAEEGHVHVMGPDCGEAMSARIPRESFESALFVCDPASGESRRLLDDKKRTFRFLAWLPDGERLVALLGDDLLEIDVKSGEQRALYTGPAALVSLCGSDVHILRRTESRVEVGRVSDGSFEVEASIDVSEDTESMAWAPDRSSLFGRLRIGASYVAESMDCHTASVRQITEKGKCPSNPTAYLHTENSALFVCSGPMEPAEVWKCLPDGSLTRISGFHDKLDRSALGQASVINYESDGWNIESLLVLPPDHQPGQRHPMLVFLHGGPEFCIYARFIDLISASVGSAAHWLAAHGYAVLLPNFRGSSGYGSEFQSEISDYRLFSTPFADVMAGIDHLITKGIADPEQLGVYGTSYGAGLTAWTIGHTDRFKGAVPSVWRYDMLADDRRIGSAFHALRPSRRGKADPNDLWFHPERYQAISPIDHLSSMKTPTLIIESGNECKLGGIGSSGWALFHGLRAFGIETYYVYYPRAFHTGGWNDEYKRDYYQRLLAWFDHCLKGAPLPDWFSANQHGGDAPVFARGGADGVLEPRITSS